MENSDKIFDLVIATVLFVGLGVGLYYAWKLWRKKTKNDETPVVEVVDPAVEAMDRLTKLLSSIEPNTAAAEAKLHDAKLATEILMKQVLRVVDKIEELERQAEFISQAVEAIRSGKRDEVAYVAGKVGDDSIRSMLLSPYITKREDFRSEAFVLLANERGSIEESAAGYGRLVTALVSQLSQARTRVIGLEQSVTMLEASHPILLIEQGLTKSIEALNLRQQPALRWTAKQSLPSGVSGYLNG